MSKNHVEGLKDLGFSWAKISTMLYVSRTTLHRQRQELVLNNCISYSEIDNEELDVVVRFILEQTPEAGDGARCTSWTRDLCSKMEVEILNPKS